MEAAREQAAVRAQARSDRDPAPVARWLGPAVASGTFADFWIYIVGPVAGALLAALGNRALVLS